MAKKLTQVAKLLLCVIAKNYSIVSPDLNVSKIRLNVHSIVIQQDKIVKMKVK